MAGLGLLLLQGAASKYPSTRAYVDNGYIGINYRRSPRVSFTCHYILNWNAVPIKWQATLYVNKGRLKITLVIEIMVIHWSQLIVYFVIFRKSFLRFTELLSGIPFGYRWYLNGSLWQTNYMSLLNKIKVK